MFDDSTRRRFVAGVVSVRAAGLSGCLGGRPNADAGTSGKTGGTGGETTRTATTTTPSPSDAGAVSEDARRRLDGRLVGLVEAGDRTAYADDHDLRYDDGRVLVVVELESGADLPPSPSVDATARRGSLVEGRVAVTDLTALATAGGVRYVRPPRAPAADDVSARLGRTGGA